MKKFIFLLLLGVGAGALVWGYRHHKEQGLLAQQGTGPASQSEVVADWNEVSTAAAARDFGGRLADAAIVTLFKGKYVFDRELSSLAIDVDCNNGRVVLTGSTESPALISRATTIASHTRGVKGVNARLIVRN